MAVTRDEVRTAAIRAFPREDAETVMAILDLYGVGPHERERERVQFDILILSASDPDLLLHYVGIAKQDYRDILFWAEYPEEARADPAEVRRLLAWLSAQAHT